MNTCQGIIYEFDIRSFKEIPYCFRHCSMWQVRCHWSSKDNLRKWCPML